MTHRAESPGFPFSYSAMLARIGLRNEDERAMLAEGGTLTVADANGSKAYVIETGVSYARSRGAEHNIINETGAEIAFVKVGRKTP